MKINPEIAYRELAVQHEFLKERILVLAQTLAERTSERDQLQAELNSMKEELANGGNDGAAE